MPHSTALRLTVQRLSLHIQTPHTGVLMAIHQDTFTAETETSSVVMSVKVMQRMFAHLFYVLAAESLILYYTIHTEV